MVVLPVLLVNERVHVCVVFSQPDALWISWHPPSLSPPCRSFAAHIVPPTEDQSFALAPLVALKTLTHNRLLASLYVPRALSSPPM